MSAPQGEARLRGPMTDRVVALALGLALVTLAALAWQTHSLYRQALDGFRLDAQANAKRTALVLRDRIADQTLHLGMAVGALWAEGDPRAHGHTREDVLNRLPQLLPGSSAAIMEASPDDPACASRLAAEAGHGPRSAETRLLGEGNAVVLEHRVAWLARGRCRELRIRQPAEPFLAHMAALDNSALRIMLTSGAESATPGEAEPALWCERGRCTPGAPWPTLTADARAALESLGFEVPVSGTSWRVVAFPDPSVPGRLNRVYLAKLGTMALILALFALLGGAALREAGRRRLIEGERDEAKVLERALLDHALFGVIACDLDGRITHFNPVAERLLGWSAAEIVGRLNVIDLHPSEDIVALLQTLPRGGLPNWPDGSPPPRRAVIEALVRRRLGSAPIDCVMNRRDGRTVPVLLSVDPLLDRRGRQIGYLGNLVDNSAQRAAAQALREAHATAQRYLDTVNELILSLDAEGRVTLINRFGLDLLGYREDEVLGRNWFTDFLPQPQGTTEVYAVYQCLMRGEVEPVAYFENPVLCADGTQRLLGWHNNALRDRAGAIVGILGAAQDITERARAREALRESQRQLRALIDRLPMDVWLKDTEGRYVQVNQVLADRAGLEPNQMIGRGDREIWPADIAEQYLRGDSAALAENRPQLLEDPLELPGGERGWCEAYKAPVHDDDGRCIGTVGFARDITERKAMEQDLRRGREAAEQLVRIKGEFLATMSHELRTPLNAILGLARIGAREQPSGPAGEALKGILTAGGHLLEVADGVLDLSRLEAGKLTLEIRACDLADTLHAAVALVAPLAASKGLDLRVALADDLPAWVSADGLRLRQLLINLLSNAVKFTAEGWVELAATWSDGMLRVCISDTGIGIEPERIARLFQPFEQGASNTTRIYGGSGLGLSISAKLATLMGGSIDAQSTLGVGSRFTLSLPLSPCDPPATPRPRLSQGPRLAGLRVLVVDDMEVNLLILEDILAQEGARCVTAPSGPEAVAHVEAGPGAFDLVLMDVSMPEMDGYEATGMLRGLDPALPVIGVTGHALPEERERALAAGMVDHLAKPVIAEALVRAARNAVAARGQALAGDGTADRQSEHA